MGFVLELKNKKATTVKYAKDNGAANSSWMSRNMIYSGLVILAFLVLHFIDFWFPEMNYKYIEGLPVDTTRYFSELQHKFVNPIRVSAYVISFVLLGLHLAHGFQSAFQSMGFNNKYTKTVRALGKIYSIAIPLGFILVAVYHYFNH
jgi:succinate dehydrogenase / fumarate reductase cytochrome b subunit